MDRPRGAPLLLLAQEVLERLKSALNMLAKLNHAAVDQVGGPNPQKLAYPNHSPNSTQ
jgi:hypothetical protein